MDIPCSTLSSILDPFTLEGISNQRVTQHSITQPTKGCLHSHMLGLIDAFDTPIDALSACMPLQ